MRSPFDDAWRGRRRAGGSGSASGRDVPGSADDLGLSPDEGRDPVDMLAIRADDELLDMLASGRPGLDPGAGSAAGTDLDSGYHDDQQMLAMLRSWRDDVHAEPIPQLVSVEEASAAIVAGHRQRPGRSRRRLVPVAAAAAAVVLGLSGVALGVGTAEPGDALWGVSKTLDGDRAASVEAAGRVSVALAAAREALAEGRVAQAQSTLATVGPDLVKVTDEETKQELARTTANLSETASAAEEGEKVRTDASGKPDPGSEPGGPGPQPTSSEPGGPQSGGPQSGGPQSGGPQSGGPETGGPQPGGPQPGGPETGGPETGGPETGGPGSTDAEPDQRDARTGAPRPELRQAPAPTPPGTPAPEQSQRKPSPESLPAKPKPDKPSSDTRKPDKPSSDTDKPDKPSSDTDKPDKPDKTKSKPEGAPALVPPSPRLGA